MGILDRLLGKKKVEEKEPEKVEPVITELEKFLADDKETYEALQKIAPEGNVKRLIRETIEKLVQT